MSDFGKLINASDLIEWIMEMDPDWCVGTVRSIVDHVEAMPSAAPEAHVIKLRADIDKDAFLEAWKAAEKNLTTFIPCETTGWIPVTERLPEPRVDVWTCSDIGQIQGYYEENVGIWYASFGQGRDYLELYVTAWMPLPDPWKGEKE